MTDTPVDNSDLSQHLGIEGKEPFVVRHRIQILQGFYFGFPSLLIAAAVGAFAFVYCTQSKEPEYSQISGVPRQVQVVPLGESYRSELGLLLKTSNGENALCSGYGEAREVARAAALLNENIESKLGNVDLTVFDDEDGCRIKQLELEGYTIPFYWEDYR